MSDKEDDPLFIKRNKLDLTSFLPKHMQYDIKLTEINTAFLLCFLVKNKGTGKLTQLVLDKNEVDSTLSYFMEKQDAVKYGYADIIKQNKDCFKLKITEKGILYYRYMDTKYAVTIPTLSQRITRYVTNFRKKLFSFVFVSVNNRIKIMMDSGIANAIQFICTLLGGAWIVYEIYKAFNK